jgi:hypothetical protein
MSVPNEGTAVIVVGIDPHKKSHTALAVSAASGELIGQLRRSGPPIRATGPWCAGPGGWEGR